MVEDISRARFGKSGVNDEANYAPEMRARDCGEKCRDGNEESTV
jgi:hypothetical protein